MRWREIVETAQAGPDIEAFAEEIKHKYGLWHFHLVPYGNSGMRLSMLATTWRDRGLGTGTKVMGELCQFADANRLRIILSPNSEDDSFGTTSRARLVRFYKRFGFFENKGRRKDFGVSDSMIREPQ